MSSLQRAIEIAVEAHRDQLDKAGQPYILHPLRVMLKLSTETERIVGVLHDVVEDGPGWTFERLSQEGFGQEVIEPLRLLTHTPGSDTSNLASYFAYVRSASKHPVARTVKFADLQDNLDLTRLPSPNERDLARLAKYEEAIRILCSEQSERT